MAATQLLLSLYLFHPHASTISLFHSIPLPLSLFLSHSLSPPLSHTLSLPIALYHSLFFSLSLSLIQVFPTLGRFFTCPEAFLRNSRNSRNSQIFFQEVYLRLRIIVKLFFYLFCSPLLSLDLRSAYTIFQCIQVWL